MNRPVFIVGCDRSGTTLLRLMLIQGPELHIPAESRFLAVLNEHSELYGNFSQPHQRWFFIRDLQTNRATAKTVTFPVFALTIEEAQCALEGAAPTNFPGAAAALYEASTRKAGKSRWGDKTPAHVRDIPWLAQAFPNAQFVHIIRDPRDVAGSIVKAGWAHGSHREAAEFWKERVQAGRNAGTKLGHDSYREIKYEALVTKPGEELPALCGWLGLEYTDKMLTTSERIEEHIPAEHLKLFPLAAGPVDRSRAQAWRQSMRRQYVADVEAVAGDTMREFGYEPSGATVPLSVSLVRFCDACICAAGKLARAVVPRTR